MTIDAAVSSQVDSIPRIVGMKVTCDGQDTSSRGTPRDLGVERRSQARDPSLALRMTLKRHLALAGCVTGRLGAAAAVFDVGLVVCAMFGFAALSPCSTTSAIIVST